MVRADRSLTGRVLRLRGTRLCWGARTYLMAIVNVLYLLSGRSDLDPVATGLIAMANNEAARVSRIVKQSLSYYRAGTSAQEVDLAALIEESVQVVSHRSDRAGVAIKKKIAPGGTIPFSVT